jgi:hypothetical protein
MAHWRMQLHPADAGSSTRHAVESLAAGFIGLGESKGSGVESSSTRPNKALQWSCRATHGWAPHNVFFSVSRPLNLIGRPWRRRRNE